MRKILIRIVLTTLFITGCTRYGAQRDSDKSNNVGSSSLLSEVQSSPYLNSYQYQNLLGNYKISIPKDAYIPNKSNTGSQIFFGNISILKPNPDSYDIEIYLKENQSCSPILTGTSRTQPISLETGSASWGRMDAWDGLGKEGWEFPQGWEDMPCKKEGTPLPKEVYTLCAEKDGKTVVICINQMTDNPEQAKEIFETFRWTE